MQFSYPVAVVVSLLISIAVILIARLRKWCLISGLILLALSAGGPKVMWPSGGKIAVMIDVSPSTRGAGFRDNNLFDRRIAELLGKANYRVYHFAAENREGVSTQELPAVKTIFKPPADADAVVLFSDGQFESPKHAPTTFVAIDANLDRVSDGRIKNIEVQGENLVARVINSGTPRQVMFGKQNETVGVGNFAISRPRGEGAMVAQIEGHDLWPENDSMIMHPPPRAMQQAWWVGARNPGGNWRHFHASELPSQVDQYLGTSVIVLDNVGARELPENVRQMLVQYVRNLGGGLAILGGDHAFSAGDYIGSELETLSPLASAPPQAARHWVLLLDSSGSMADADKWSAASVAMNKVLRVLPPNDSVTLGSFAKDVRWWRSGKAQEITALPPGDVQPNGPTNLAAAIDALSAQGPAEVILLTDAQAQIEEIPRRVATLRDANVHVHALLIEPQTTSDLRQVIRGTGGTLVNETDPQKWGNAMEEIARSARGEGISHESVTLRFMNDLRTLPGRTIDLWNRVWVKENAKPQAAAEGLPNALAAQWRVGLGNVAAMATGATMHEARALADLVERAPADPRFALTWKLDRQMVADVDASGDGRYINDAEIVLEINGQKQKLDQVGPGKYEGRANWPSAGGIATVWCEGRVLGRTALAARYAEEFAEIGNSRERLSQLAKQTNGRVIEPADRNPIDFNWPPRQIDLTSWLAAAGAICIAISLVRRRALV